jgi:hypothetical protein
MSCKPKKGEIPIIKKNVPFYSKYIEKQKLLVNQEKVIERSKFFI